MICEWWITYDVAERGSILGGRVSKYVTNGSKIDVMDVIGGLCVSLGRSTVSFMTVWVADKACACSDAGFSSQNGHRAWGCTTEEKSSIVRFYNQEERMQSIFIKKCFLFTVESVCRLKRFATWSRNSLKDVRKSQMMPDHVALLRLRQEQLVEITIKRLLCFRFRRTCKAMEEVYECWWRICRETKFFPISNITYFTFYIHLWRTYWLSLVF
jgi:hypothetical protein